MTLLLLIRHALTDSTGTRLSGQAEGVHLSQQGRHQAEALADRLRAVPLAAVYTSPLERCVETAEFVGRVHDASPEPLPGLLEVDYGRWTGRPMAQLARTALWKRVQTAPSSVRFPEGETLEEVQVRSVRALSAAAARHPKAVVACVTHAEVIRLAMAHFAGVHIDLFQRLVVHPASVSAVAVGDGMPRILRMNDTGAIDDLVPRRRPARDAGRKRSLR
ncbi:MAG: MSMEG_4193 family putative phosphomutase [Actinomycetota bacterium]